MKEYQRFRKMVRRKINDLELRTYTNHEGDFFAVMGKYFAFRDWAHEMGGWQFYSKPGSVWFVLLLESEVTGFCSIINEKTHAFFDNMYVLPEYRNRGYSRILWDARLKYALSVRREIRVISDNPIQIKRYEECGMKFYGMRGRYSKYKKQFETT